MRRVGLSASAEFLVFFLMFFIEFVCVLHFFSPAVYLSCQYDEVEKNVKN